MCGVKSFPGKLIISFPRLKPSSGLHHCLKDEVQAHTTEYYCCGLIYHSPVFSLSCFQFPQTSLTSSQLQAFVYVVPHLLHPSHPLDYQAADSGDLP